MDAKRSIDQNVDAKLAAEQTERINAACDSLAITEAKILELARPAFYGKRTLVFNYQNGFVESVRDVGVEQTFKIPRRTAA